MPTSRERKRNVLEEERQRIKDLAKFAKGEQEQGDLRAYWRATNLLPGALGEARVSKNLRDEIMEPLKKSFYGEEEEKDETYTFKIWSALEKSGVPPPHAYHIAKALAIKWFAKHMQGEREAAGIKFMLNRALEENTPLMYNRLAKRIHRLIGWTLAAPTSKRAEWARIRLQQIIKTHNQHSQNDPFSKEAMYALELAKRPGRLAATLMKGEKALDEHLEKLKKKYHERYKDRIMRLGAIINQVDSALHYMQYGVNYTPEDIAKMHSVSMVNPKNAAEARRAANIARLSFIAFAKAAKETKEHMGLKREEMHFTSKDAAIQRLMEIRQELEELFPEIRKELKRKVARY